MTQPQLDLLGLASNLPTGFRLHHMELYNWGTFHEHIWHINPEGNNSLLTGDIGSGKSTVVDTFTEMVKPMGGSIEILTCEVHGKVVASDDDHA